MKFLVNIMSDWNFLDHSVIFARLVCWFQ